MKIEIQETPTEIYEPPGNNSQWKDWKRQIRNAVTEISRLNKIFLFNEIELKALIKTAETYPFSVTQYYLSLIDKDNPRDPIRLQCIPSPEEDKLYLGLQDDPLGEEKDSVMPGLIHRYPDRVLITLTNICPVYCRHCTRKREWCAGRWIRKNIDLENIYRYIWAHREIRDVILSGGDPLILSTEKLETILKNLRIISHVEIVRIGTRCPVVLPQRIDGELVSTLKRYRPIWINTQFNHPNEITKESSEACDRILCAGIPINNQCVLLKGINDNVKIMTKLCQGLLKIGVRPYYLFQCDPVKGAGHFRTPIEKGLEIINGMRGFTSGLCVPNFVVDGLEGQGKVPLQLNCLVSKEKRCMLLRGYKGEVFRYYNPED